MLLPHTTVEEITTAFEAAQARGEQTDEAYSSAVERLEELHPEFPKDSSLWFVLSVLDGAMGGAEP